jgi:hypothetical protein
MFLNLSIVLCVNPLRDIFILLTCKSINSFQPENKNIFYSISKVDPVSGASLFQVGPKGGLVVTANALSTVKTPDVFKLTVTAENQVRNSPAGTPMIGTATVTVTIIRNKNAPSFTPNPYSITRDETTNAGTSIGKYTATDLDKVSSVLVFFFF